MEDILSRLRQFRAYTGLKQGEFAKRLKLPQNSYSQIETGVNPIKDRHIALICLTFGINEGWLRYGKGEMLDKEAADTVSGPEILDEEGKPLTYEEEKFIKTYRRLAEPNKSVARRQVDVLLDEQEKAEKKDEKAG